MSKIISSTDELFNELRLDRQQPKVVSIDGDMGAGKSILACEIADDLGFDIFDLDCYLTEKVSAEKGYVGTICLDSLLRDIKYSLCNGKDVVVEGVCVLNVLDRIGISSNVKIYVDEIYLAVDSNFVLQRSSTEILEDIPDGAFLSCEIQRYHKSMKPYEVADIIFERAKKRDLLEL